MTSRKYGGTWEINTTCRQTDGVANDSFSAHMHLGQRIFETEARLGYFGSHIKPSMMSDPGSGRSMISNLPLGTKHGDLDVLRDRRSAYVMSRSVDQPGRSEIGRSNGDADGPCVK
jgi:hypothetical protein